MLSTAIIIFRETIEIAMILGVVLAATKGLAGRTKWIVLGLCGGIAGAALVAGFAKMISSTMAGMGQEFFNAGILFTAAIVIGWTVVWLRKNARHMVMHLKQVGHEVQDGKLPLYSLAVIIGLALLREGSEIVLFIYGMSMTGQTNASIAAGSVIGFGLGTIVGILLYYGLLKMPARQMLRFTGWLLILLVAGLASQGVEYLAAAGYFNDLSAQVWDTSWLLSEDSILGKSLHSLIGYSARPSEIQLIVYLGTLAGLLLIIRYVEGHKGHALAVILVPFLLVFAMSAPRAFALDEIYSPDLVHHELSLEYNGSRTFDHDSSKNNAQEHEIALEAGVADYWTIEFSGGFEKDPGGDLDLVDGEIENRFQFTDPGEYWADSGVLVAYDFATRSGDADSIETKLLLQKDVDRWTHTANIGFEQEVGHNAQGGPDYVFLWNSRYRYNKNFQPGIEIQSDLGDEHTLGHFNQQEHYIGPASYGEIVPHLKYQAALLFGATGASAQAAARVLFEYESHF